VCISQIVNHELVIYDTCHVQLKKLEQSEFSTLLGLLSHYPRAYKLFTPQVQAHLPEQCVEVTATVM